MAILLLRDGSASGDILETIAVSSGNVSISGAQLTINPSSNFLTGKNIYVVIPDGAFTSVALQSNIDAIDTYNFSTGIPLSQQHLVPLMEQLIKRLMSIS